MKINKLTWAILVVTTLSLSSCYWHNWENLHPITNSAPCAVIPGATVSYSTTIQPILVAKCAQSSCHDGSSHAIFTNDFRTWGDSVAFTGTAADFWGADTSVASPNGVANGWQYITGTGNGATDKMPKSGYPQLTPCEIKAIGSWIHQGGKNN